MVFDDNRKATVLNEYFSSVFTQDNGIIDPARLPKKLGCDMASLYLSPVMVQKYIQEAQLSLRDRATRACQLKSGKVLHKCRRLVFEKL